MDDLFGWLLEPVTRRFQQPCPPNIADPFADVLRFLENHTAEVSSPCSPSVFYDGWRPTHQQVADIVRSHCTEQTRRSLDRHLRSRPDPTAGDSVGVDASNPESF